MFLFIADYTTSFVEFRRDEVRIMGVILIAPSGAKLSSNAL
jgi:hypothetical protein